MSGVDRDTWPEDLQHPADAAGGGPGRRRRARFGSVVGGATRDPSHLLAFPRVPGRLVRRSRQLERLDRLAPLTVVETLPGFGKSTLAAQWGRAHDAAGGAVVWISAVSEVDDPVAFLGLLHQGLVRAGVLSASTVPTLRLDGRPTWADEIASADPPVLVIVDDAHRLRNPVVAEAVVRLVRQAQSLHVAVFAEADHHFEDVATSHALETNVLRGGDLTVPVAELPEFARAWGHPLSAEASHRLHRLVGGWLLPLRLVLDATPSWSEGVVTHTAQDFLTRRVLHDIGDAATLSAATRLAVPEHLDLPLAEAILGDAAVDLLSDLEHQGLLWRSSRLDGEIEWCYPELVRRALLGMLERTDPDGARAAHRAAAHLFAADRGIERSNQLLRHARAAGDWALLQQTWTDRGWSLAGADPVAFELAYGRLPPGVLDEQPSLRLAAALGDALRSTHDGDWMLRVEALLQHYMEAGSDLARHRDRSGSPTALAEMLTAAMVAQRSEGHLPEALRLAGEASRELSRARLIEPTRLRSSQVAWFHLQNAITQLQSGKFGDALEAAATAHRLGPGNLVGTGSAGLLAAVYATTGHSKDAREWLTRHEATDVADHWAAGLAELPGRLARVMLALDRLDAASAAAELAEVPIGPEASGLWPLIVVTHARYELLFGDPEAMLHRLEHLKRVLARHARGRGGMARQVFDRCTAELLLAMGEVNRFAARLESDLPPWMSVPTARFHLMTGSPTKAAELAVAGAWRNDVHTRDRLELLMIAAVAKWTLGEADQAEESFRRAHALGVETDNHQLWLLMSAPVREELLRLTGLELDPQITARVDRIRPTYPEHAELVRLSERELEVLRQIRHHDTAADLAKTLTVSINTVKKQLTSLYAKLGVHDRGSALLRAQRLGLIEDSRGVIRS